jgi:hypothetical protein
MGNRVAAGSIENVDDPMIATTNNLSILVRKADPQRLAPLSLGPWDREGLDPDMAVALKAVDVDSTRRIPNAHRRFTRVETSIAAASY